MRFHIFSLLFTTFLFFSSIAALHPSPSATADLICHTNHASECYPRLFQPTTDFRPIHKDQVVPEGLHIRINLATGHKEAKINIPSAEDDNDLGNQMVLVDSGDTISNPEDPPPLSLIDRSGKKRPSPYHHGLIRPPPTGNGEEQIFASSITTLKSPTTGAKALLPALANLEDLAHDIYWGISLAQDPTAVRRLVSLLGDRDADPTVRGLAALVLGSAVQNNPVALAATQAHFDNTYGLPDGPLEVIVGTFEYERNPEVLTRFVHLLSVWCRDEAQFERFVEKWDMTVLQHVFDAERAGDERDRLRGKIADFVLDHLILEEGWEAAKRESSDAEKVSQSLLSDEDSWVMIDEHDDDAVKHDSQTSHANDPGVYILRPWCKVFSASLEGWARNTDDEKSRDAVERVQNAYSALQYRAGACQ